MRLTPVDRDPLDAADQLAGLLRTGAPVPLDLGTWAGDALRTWLTAGGDLAAHLGLRPDRGSRLTPAREYAYRRRAALLRQLVRATGGQRQALAVLRDQAGDDQARAIVDQARALRVGLPLTRSSLSRALRRC